MLSSNFKNNFHHQKKERPTKTRITIYLQPAATGHGAGFHALQQIETHIRESGFSNIVALISADNKPCCRLFEKGGYQQCALLKNVAEKFGRKLSLCMYQKLI